MLSLELKEFEMLSIDENVIEPVSLLLGVLPLPLREGVTDLIELSLKDLEALLESLVESVIEIVSLPPRDLEVLPLPLKEGVTEEVTEGEFETLEDMFTDSLA